MGPRGADRTRWSLGDGTFHIDNMTIADPSRADRILLRIKEVLLKIYQYCSIFIFIIGGTAFVAAWISLALKKSSFDALMALSTSLWALYLSRVAILILVDVTSFPTLSAMYMMPAFPIWFAAAFVSVSVMWIKIQGVYGRANCSESAGGID